MRRRWQATRVRPPSARKVALRAASLRNLRGARSARRLRALRDGDFAIVPRSSRPTDARAHRLDRSIRYAEKRIANLIESLAHVGWSEALFGQLAEEERRLETLKRNHSASMGRIETSDSAASGCAGARCTLEHDAASDWAEFSDAIVIGPQPLPRRTTTARCVTRRPTRSWTTIRGIFVDTK